MIPVGSRDVRDPTNALPIVTGHRVGSVVRPDLAPRSTRPNGAARI